ncbi:MAG TPA: SDR family NAD(P)-dependent oxidoreductase [Terriglobia bacterium]|nr:SDR family NAD(P)-dependent oxidoreductase [Terriglobia bacterium]
MSERLLGKVCIITGTGGSIDREAALTFAREGALVVGCDMQVEAAQSTVETVRAAAGLNALLALFDTAEAYAEARRINRAVLLNE